MIPGDKILLIDDEEEFLEVLAERMENRGLRVETAIDGEKALEKVRKSSFDAILLDLAMPGLDGLETLKKLKAIDPALQIILLTGKATLQKGIEAIKLGALDLMEKPADIKELMAKIEEASSKKALLVQERVQEELKNILSRKGW